MSCAVGGLAGLGIDLREDVLEDRLTEAGELAGLPIELPQDAGLADREQRALGADVDEHLLEHFVHVERLARDVLVVPGERAVLRVERDGGGRIERRVGDLVAAARRHPRLGLRDAVVDQVEFRIVAAGDPGLAALPHVVGQRPPRVAARLARVGHGVELPEELARLRVVGADEAALGAIAVAPLQALDHLAAHHDRAAGVGEAFRAIGDRDVPGDFARPRVERDEPRVGGGEEDLVLVDGDVAHRPEPDHRVRARPGFPRSGRRWRRRAPAPC